MIRVLRGCGFAIEDLIELQAPAAAQSHASSDIVAPAWAYRWPSEEIWQARKR